MRESWRKLHFVFQKGGVEGHRDSVFSRRSKVRVLWLPATVMHLMPCTIDSAVLDMPLTHLGCTFGGEQGLRGSASDAVGDVMLV
jgi:hypothetical protein